VRGPDLKGAAFDLKCKPFGQSQGDLPMCLRDDTLKGGAGYTHASSRLSLGQALQVGQAQGFQFFWQQSDSAYFIQRYTCRLVDQWPGQEAEKPPFARSGHLA
jgi:hypothetical protein